MADKKFERFGKYLILDHLVDGGMAKICRARFLGEQSNKIVAIKMVQPQFSRDPSFVRMFQDELSVTFGLQHPNIAQVYDYGKVNDQLYTAMEYVDGANLKQFLDRLKEKNYVFPVEISVYIISQVCQGLHYAHTFQDKLSGKPLHIVHRDISPHNIMLTHDGAVKVIDFGIAKANTNSESTQAGTIKGKLSYLAPEYLEGLELDHRYDLFAVGITLWEMLCSRKLFTAANDLAVLKQIQNCKVTPPSQINPNVPKELDAIVMKALSKDRSLRYEDMDKFNRALVKFLYAQYPDFNPSDLSYFAKELFKEEIKRDKEKFVEYGKIDVTPYIEALKNDEASGTGGGGTPQVAAVVEDPNEPKRRERIEIDLNVDRKTVTGIELSEKPHKAGATRKIQRPSLASKAAAAEAQSGATKTNVEKSAAHHTRTTSRAKMAKAGKPKTAGKPAVYVAAIAMFVGLAYFNGDFVEEILGVNPYSMIHGKSQAAANRGPAAPGDVLAREGSVTLGGMDLEMEVWVDGRKFPFQLGRPIKVPLGQDVTISVRKPGHKAFNRTLKFPQGQSDLFMEVPQMERSRTGLLSSSANFPAGSVLVYTVDGQKIEKTLPFQDMSVPVGTYHATVVNPILGTEKKLVFTVEENKQQLLEDHRAPAGE